MSFWLSENFENQNGFFHSGVQCNYMYMYMYMYMYIY